MVSKIEVRLHLWPWSVDVEEETRNLIDGNVVFPFFGSPVVSVSSQASLFLPQRHERFVPFGPEFLTIGGECHLYETPHGVMSAQGKPSDDTDGRIIVRTRDLRETVDIFPQGAKPRRILKKKEAEIEETDLARTVLSWSQFFDDLIEEAKELSQENKLAWLEIKKFISHISEDVAEPRMALIVNIAQRMQGNLASVVDSARKILVRERCMLPAGRVAETDAACLQWFVRQPGDTMGQKAAANRQRLLGVARRESFDTLENKILKDFLSRSAREGRRYLDAEVGDDAGLQRSRRACLVRGYRQLCNILYRVPHLKNVAMPPPSPCPNYVLQNDYRYKKMWQQYLRLLRHEDDEDRFWDWQSRTWADVSRFLVNFSLFGLSQPKETRKVNIVQLEEILTSVVHLLREQHLGSRVVAGSEPGPFVVCRRGITRSQGFVLEVVHSDQAGEHEATRGLGRLGGHLYLVLSSLGGCQQSVIVVWAVHTAGVEEHPPWKSICDSAWKALQLHKAMLHSTRVRDIPELHGFIIASDLKSQSTELHSDSKGRLHLVQVATDQRYWEDASEAMELVIEDILSSVL